MKVKCQLCGKKFELEKNDYRCPKCASYYHVDGEERVYARERHYAKESVHTELKEKYDLNSDNTATPKELTGLQVLWKLVKGVIITAEVIFILFLLSMPFLGIYSSKEKAKEQKVYETPPITSVTVKDSITIGDYTLKVTDYYIDDIEKWVLPDNYVVYAVEYDTVLGEGLYYSTLYNLCEVYLETESGMTFSAVDKYDLMDYMKYDEGYKLVEDRAADYLKSGGGILFFVVKEDEEVSGLYFDVYIGDDEDYQYRELSSTYFMYVDSWEVE